MFSFIVCNTNEVKSPLVDARFQVESGTWANGITVAYAASVNSDFLRSAVIFCTDYWFTRSFRLPRPASPASTSKVETVHPQDLTRLHTSNLENKKRISYPLFNCQLLPEQESSTFYSCAVAMLPQKLRCRSGGSSSVNQEREKVLILILGSGTTCFSAQCARDNP